MTQQPTRSALDVFIKVEAEKQFLESNSKIPKPGHNGPYGDPETPVRNLCHWISAYSLLFKLTNTEEYRQELLRLTKALLNTPQFKPHGLNYAFRNGSKDKCNGLIGPAWLIEALCEAHSVLEDKKLIDEAKRIYSIHPFSNNTGLWKRIEINGKNLKEDPTFNHQLWFAMSACLIYRQSNSNKILGNINTFLNNLDKNLDLMEDGIIYHPITRIHARELKKNNNLYSRLRNLLKTLITHKSLGGISYILSPPSAISPSLKASIREKSIGYHFFNTYAFSVMNEIIPHHPFWASKKLDKILSVFEKQETLDKIFQNKYSFPYNPPGYEATFTAHVFKKQLASTSMDTLIHDLLKKQLQMCYSPDQFLMANNVSDTYTHTARIYEALRLPTEILKMKII